MQQFEIINAEIKEFFLDYKRKKPEKIKNKLKFSWSNWGFGMEDLEVSMERLTQNGIKYIELHGNLYGNDLGYSPEKVNGTLKKYSMIVSGICGMFLKTNDLSSNIPMYRQNAIDYLKRTIPFTKSVGGIYLLVVPGAVGRPEKYDDFEIYRSAETLRAVADLFVQYRVKAAVEPIRSAEVSIVHTFNDAEKYIDLVNHKGVQNINGDVYHMLIEESHIAERILDSGSRMVNLHLADTNRGALGEGCLDIDTIMMALYLINYNNEDRFCTAEPLGPGGDPYPAIYGRPEKSTLDKLVQTTITTWNEREDYVRSL